MMAIILLFNWLIFGDFPYNRSLLDYFQLKNIRRGIPYYGLLLYYYPLNEIPRGIFI